MQQDRQRFWTFSLSVYGDAAVQRECLDLQDHDGVNVNLLLFCAFVGSVHGAVLSRAAVKQANGVVHIWHEQVVSRLRAVRRALKSFGDDAESIGFDSLCNGVKARELDAERLEQRMLECWAAKQLPGWSKAQPSVAVEKNITALFEVSGEKVPRPRLPNNLMSRALQHAAKSQKGIRCQP